jgi:hypothetical protein
VQAGNGLEPPADLGAVHSVAQIRRQQHQIEGLGSRLHQSLGAVVRQGDVETLVDESAAHDQALTGVRVDD